jgi:archaeal flagellar protein FlaJ
MKLNLMHWVGMSVGFILLLVNIIFFREDKIFFFLIGISVVIAAVPFLASFLIERNIQNTKNEMFLEFSRNLAENVKTGTPIGKAILNMRGKNFGSLTPHVEKLSNQISIGIPINRAFLTFSKDIESDTIRRAIALIREAESAGGNIENILDSVASSMYQIEKLKQERKATIYNLVVQGYVIFFIFIGIMLVMQFQILPLTSDIGTLDEVQGFGGGGGVSSLAAEGSEALARPFLYLLLAQGIFAGLTIGKLAEGSIKAGVKHSFILTTAAFLISTGANAFITTGTDNLVAILLRSHIVLSMGFF